MTSVPFAVEEQKIMMEVRLVLTTAPTAVQRWMVMGMYKSPIELIYHGMEMQIEKGIVKAVQKQDINVDKEELIRALEYDRGQYEKGYADGEKDASPKWTPVTEQLPECDERVLVVDRVTGEVTTAYLNLFDSFVFRDGRGHGVTYWMPLPEPPKEENDVNLQEMLTRCGLRAVCRNRWKGEGMRTPP